MPTTSVHHLLDGKLLVYLRSWGSQDYDQKFIEEVMHFLSTAQADIEITSPFDYVENLTSLANKIRISLLLAHDYFYKIENKNSLSVGFEVAIFMRVKNEIAWATVGRFDVSQLTHRGAQLLSSAGTDRDKHVLLPVELLGVEKDFDLRCGSVAVSAVDPDSAESILVVSSTHCNLIEFKQDEKFSGWSIEASKPDGAYWFSKIKSE